MRSCQKTIAPKKRGEVFNLIQKRGKRKKPENRANTRFKGISGSVGGNVYFDPWIDQKSRRSVKKNSKPAVFAGRQFFRADCPGQKASKRKRDQLRSAAGRVSVSATSKASTSSFFRMPIRSATSAIVPPSCRTVLAILAAFS